MGINLQNNPLSAKNLDKLSNEQFAKLVNGIKEQKIKIHSFKGTILMDLLEHIKNGDNSQRQQAYQLQAVLQSSPIENEQQPTNSNFPWIIGGVAIVSVAVIVSYLWGKNNNS